MQWFGVSLGERNEKLGEIASFSLPSLQTCPGASSWCKERCYAARYERLRPSCRKAYARNLALALDADAFAERMIGVLPRILSSMRIHVSGDFHTVEYIRAWTRICKAFPQTRFWAYTRSWSVEELLPALEELRALPNVELFASVDPTMPLPPKSWRIAYVDGDPRAKGMLCRAQVFKEETCSSCGYCFQRRRGHVVFRVH